MNPFLAETLSIVLEKAKEDLQRLDPELTDDHRILKTSSGINQHRVHVLKEDRP